MTPDKEITLPYGGEALTIELPENWRVVLNASPKNLPEATDGQMREAILDPISSDRLCQIAKGKETAAIVVDDYTRPTPAHRILPIILDELGCAGIRDDNIVIVAALGAHRKMTSKEIVRKVGQTIANRIKVINHDCETDLSFMGYSDLGTPIWLNSHVAKADVIIGIAGVIPNLTAGFGGGAKIILPGVCGLKTISQNHALREIWEGTFTRGFAEHSRIEGNRARQDIEDVGRKIGLDFVVNVVFNAEAKICGTFAGEPVASHRDAVRLARDVYTMKTPRQADLVITTSSPVDIDIYHAIAQIVAAFEVVRDGGTILELAPCPDGLGYHKLYASGTERATTNLKKQEKMTDIVNITVFSDNVLPEDFHKFLHPKIFLARRLDEAIDRISQEQEGTIEAIVLPRGAISVPVIGA